MFETDEKGKWKVTKGANCKVRLLVEPSQAFLDWQASNPVVELEPVIDIPAKLKDLEDRIANLER